MNTETYNSITPDYSHWAKKFDEVKHIYAPKDGTLCGSVAHCLGNNYSTNKMPICTECLKFKTHKMSNLIHSIEREKELQDLCNQVLEASPNRYYNPNGADETTCPFCCEKDYSIDCNAEMKDIEHKINCAYNIAKGLLTNINKCQT